MESTGIPLHLGFLWDTLEKTIALPEDKTTQVEALAQKLLAVDTTIQENLECFVVTLISTTPVDTTTQQNLECFVGTLISFTPVVWQDPLHYRAL